MSAARSTHFVPASKPRHSLRQLLSAIPLALSARRQRRQLAALPTYLLEDIGLSNRMAEDEAARPIWDVPQHWRR